MRVWSGLAALILLCLTLFLGLARRGEARSSSLIAFISDRSGNEDIYLMLPDGRQQRPLIQHPAYDWYPAWSPEGQRIVFVSDRGGTHDLFLLDLRKQTTRQLTAFEGIERYPTWSPDGEWIYFVTDKDGFYTALYQIKADGSGLNLVRRSDGDMWSPDVSPDGEQLVFTARTAGYRNQMFTWNLRTETLSYLGEAPWDYFFPQWSPDGQAVLFNSFGRSSNDDVYILGAGGLQQLTTGYSEDRMAVWSPEGASIVFMSRRAGNWDLFRMNLADGSTQPLTRHLAADWSPAWSPVLDLPWAWGWNVLAGLFLLILAARKGT